MYYVYHWLRTDSTPYYVGKGCKKRAWDKKRYLCPTDDTRIVIVEDNMTEAAAFDLEIEHIAKYGRKDIGTGILHNKTDGGEGCSGAKHTAAWKKQASEIMLDISKDPAWRANLSKKVTKTMNTPEFKEAQSKRVKAGHAKSDKMEDRGNNISKTKQSTDWQETVLKEAHKKKMKTQRTPEAIAARKARNTKPCPKCGDMIYGKGNMHQHLTRHG
jgi:hypothetical protein